MDPHIYADLDPGSQNLADLDPGSQNLTDPDPESQNLADPDSKHWLKQFSRIEYINVSRIRNII